MKLILDERERELFQKCESITSSTATYIQLSKEVLPLGDIYVKTDEDKDVMLIERKSLSDLLSSIKDGRYEEQSYRLTHSSGFPPHSIVYIIEGSILQLRTPMERKIVYSAITSLNFFKGFSVIRTSNISETAEYIIWMAEKIERNFLKCIFPYYLQPEFCKYMKQTAPASENTGGDSGQLENVLTPQITSANYCSVVKKVKKDNVTPENIGEIILCQIPGISSVSAMAIMKKFVTFPQLIKELERDPNCLNDIMCETKGKVRKLGKNCIENIISYLSYKSNVSM